MLDAIRGLKLFRAKSGQARTATYCRHKCYDRERIKKAVA
jgi:hypothetical protein